MFKRITSLLILLWFVVIPAIASPLMLLGCGSTSTSGAALAATAASQFTSANSEFLSIADNASLSFGNEDFSIAGWVYLDSSPTWQMPFGKWRWSDNKREYGIYNNNGSRQFGFFVDSTGSSQTNVTSATAVPLSTWAYIVGVHDSVNNLLKISINGANFETTAYSSGCNNNTGEFLIGGSNSSASIQELFNGRICKVGVWRKALSQSEVTQLYNAGNGLAYCQLDSGLLTSLEAYWNLSESSGTRADSTANANNLNDNNTVTGNPGVGVVGSSKFAAFSRSSPYLSIADNASLSTGDIDYSVAGWFRLNRIDSSYTALINKYDSDGGTKEYFLAHRGTSNRFVFGNYTGGGSFIGEATADNFGAVSAYDLVFIAAGHSAADNVNWISVNGGTVNTLSTGGSAPGDTSAGVAIGRAYNQNSYHLDGIAKNCAFWKRDIRSDVAALYALGNSAKYSDLTAGQKTSLQSFWINDGDLNTDASGNSNTLTNNNNVTVVTGSCL